jgi:hypothetical protein
LTEKTEGEVRTDTGALALALEKLDSIEKRIANIEKRMVNHSALSAKPRCVFLKA